MTVELLQTLSLISFIIAGVLLLVGVALFFLLDIPKLYGEISGRTARKAIEAIQRQNQENQTYSQGSANASRVKLTDKITKSGKLESQTAGLPVSTGTQKFATSALIQQANETTVLTAEQANETTVLTAETASETTVLTQEECVIQEVHNPTKFTIEVEMSFTGSAELIE